MLNSLSAGVRWLLVTIIVITAALFMLNASGTDSAVMDELAHIPAGYSYVKYLDYRLNPEHPPLVKALAALPLLLKDLNFPISQPAWHGEVNSQWAIGNQFLYESGNNADEIIFLARIGPILLTLLLIIVTYLVAKELIGRWWALLPASLVAFSPNFLAHGHYVATDIGAALGFVLAIAAFLKFLESPSKKHLFLAGLAFGCAQLLKFSAVLLVPYFLLVTVLYYIVSVIRDSPTTDHNRGWFRRFGIRFFRHFRALGIIFLLGYFLVFIVYLPLTWNYPAAKQVADAEFMLSSFTPQFLVDFTTWLAGIPVLRAFGEYLTGLLMVSQRVVGGNSVYFLGEVSNVGWRYYFPVIFLLKEPIPSLALVVFAALLSLWKFVKAAPGAILRRLRPLFDWTIVHFAEFAILLFVILYWASSIVGNLNIGVRHILPTLPLVYILAAGVIKNWFNGSEFGKIRDLAIKISVIYKELVSVSAKSAILTVLIIWYLLTPLIIAPHFLSYYNIFGGGTKNGYRYAVDSNYDWGQDLKRLKIWVKDNLPAGKKIAIDYFGGGNLKYSLGEAAEPWWSARGSPINEDIKWLAVSVSAIQGAKGQTIRGFTRKPEDEYQWLKEPYKPFARAGTSIFIYKLD